MKKELIYRTRGTCARAIEVHLDDGGTVTGVRFMGGCMGNTQGVAKLALGRPAREVIELLRGIDCGGKGTSCPDQLALALTACLEDTN